MSDDRTDDLTDDEPSGQPAPTIAKVTIKGPDIDITRAVNEGTMASIIALLFGVTPAAPGGRGGGTGGSGGRGTGGAAATVGGGSQSSQWDEDLTLGEFIVETDARTFQHKICAAGYYLMNFRGSDSFDRDEVRSALADAHEDMPGNFGRDFRDAASKSFIAGKQGEPGRFIVPRTGRTAVESQFQDVPKRRAARKTTRKASPKGDAE